MCITKKTLIILMIFTIFAISCVDKSHTPDKEIILVKQDRNYESDSVKNYILEKLNKIAVAIEKKDMVQLSKFVHPVKGIRFSNFGYVDIKNDVVVSKEDIKNFFNNEYIFRYYDEMDDMPSYKETGIEYFNNKIYFSDFSKATLGYNKRVELYNYPTSPGSHFDVYKNAIIVELYFENNFPEKLDWKIIRFVFECYNNEYFLVGIVNDEWTP